MCDLELDEQQQLFFATVTAFNINARYDDYKMSFQKKMHLRIYNNLVGKIKGISIMDKKTDSVIKKYVSSVATQTKGFVNAYLFGSYAKNTQRPESDIDIALVFDSLSDSDKFDMQVQLMLLAMKFDSRIEPHPISAQDMLSSNPFINEIKETGVSLQ